jgi:hypothetical protein
MGFWKHLTSYTYTNMKNKILIAILLLGILAVVGGYLWSKNQPKKDFPYVIKDGQVYCAEHLQNILTDGTLLLEEADAATFRRPTQAEYDSAMAKSIGAPFVIDAVDKNNSYYQCSRINFSGTI